MDTGVRGRTEEKTAEALGKVLHLLLMGFRSEVDYARAGDMFRRS